MNEPMRIAAAAGMSAVVKMMARRAMSSWAVPIPVMRRAAATHAQTRARAARRVVSMFGGGP